MLLVKCGQCGASYKLPEELYRRKAAGFGVVVTCRRCKTEIHVDAEPPTVRAEDLAENDAAPTAPTHERPEPPATLEDETPLPGMPEPELTRTPEPVAKLAPSVPNAAKPSLPMPRAPGAPRPAAPTVKGLGVGAVTEASARPANEAKALSPPAPRVQPAGKTAPKLVALSPGLLGTVTAPKPKPPVPPATAAVSPSPPRAASPTPPATALPPVSPGNTALGTPPAPKPARELEEAGWDPSVPPPPPEHSAPDSEIPIASQDFLSVDSAPLPELGVESKDVVTDASSARASIDKEPDVPKKRLPEAPAAKRGSKAQPKSDELPSTTGTPKLDTLIHGTAVLLDQKKGEPPRRRQPSGDLSDDFMNADLGFDTPALAPPNADALTRAPVSSRPQAAAPTASNSPVEVRDTTGGSSKSARPVSVKAEKKAASGRGWLALLLLVVLGVGGFAFRHRLGRGSAVNPESIPATSPPKSEPPTPEAPAAEPAKAPAEPAAPNAQPTGEGVTDTPPVNAQGTPATPSPGAAVTPRPQTAAPTGMAPSNDPATRNPATPEPATPSLTAPIEPRPPVGTEPFDAAAARVALDASAAQASSCRKPGDPSGVAVVIITFSPTGRVTTANISGPPFAATPTGGCIASTLRKTKIPAFAGDMVTVKKTVTIN
jgi:hypothetical protein